MDELTCREVIGFLDDYHGGALASDRRAAFDAHLQQCRHCRDYLRTYVDTIAMGRAALTDAAEQTPASLPAPLLDAILSAVRRPPA